MCTWTAEPACCGVKQQQQQQVQGTHSSGQHVHLIYYSSTTTLPRTESRHTICNDQQAPFVQARRLTMPHQSGMQTCGTARTHSVFCHLACVSSSGQQAAGGAAAGPAAAAKPVEQLRVTATSTTPAQVPKRKRQPAEVCASMLACMLPSPLSSSGSLPPAPPLLVPVEAVMIKKHH
jgi:hypothetical protein